MSDELQFALRALFIVGALSLFGLFVVAILWFRRNGQHQKEMLAMQRASIEKSELAGSRSVGAEHTAEAVGKKVDNLIKRMESTPPGGVPPVSSMSWLVACGLAAA